MAWVRLDDSMPHHPKVMAAGYQAFALDVAGICYSNRYGTDGFIPTSALPGVLPTLSTPKKWARSLVEAGRWFEVEGGWQIHDIGDYQPTAAESKNKTEAKARAGSKGNHTKWHTERGEIADDCEWCEKESSQEPRKPLAENSQVRSQNSRPVPSRPLPVLSDTDVSRNGAASDLLFEAVCEASGIDWQNGMTKSERGEVNNAVKQLREVGADPFSVQRFKAAYHLRWPGMDLTPSAMVKHWSKVQGPLPPSESDVEQYHSEMQRQRRLRELEAIDNEKRLNG